jgi:hypothetical protein
LDRQTADDAAVLHILAVENIYILGRISSTFNADFDRPVRRQRHAREFAGVAIPCGSGAVIEASFRKSPLARRRFACANPREMPS